MNTNDLIQLLNQNWIGTTIAIIGIIVAIGLAYSFKPNSRIAARTNTLRLVGPNAALPKEIEFLFKGTKVPNITMSRIAVWNIGNTTIRSDQIVNSDPFRITTSEGSSILEATLLNRTRQVNDVSCALRKDKPSEVEVRFDYLDPGDGALIQIIHTGDEKVTITGTLRGVPKSVLMVGVSPKQKVEEQTLANAREMRQISLLLFIATIVLSVGALAGILIPKESTLLLAALVALIAIISYLLASFLPPPGLDPKITSGSSK